MEPQSKSRFQRGLTWRSVVVCLVALFVMGIWIEYEENYTPYGGPLAENSPPNSAVGVILAVLGISAILYKLRKPLRLASAELVVIYSALVLAAPLITQGMWHRFFGLVAAIPHNEDFKSYDSLPPMLWPHGPNVVANGQFREGLKGFSHSGGGSVVLETVDRGGKGVWTSPVLSNAEGTNAACTLSFSIPRFDEVGRPALRPGEKYLFCMLIRTAGFAKGSSYTLKMQADDDLPTTLLASAEETKPTFANPDGFRRIGINPVTIPTGLARSLTFSLRFSGLGRLAIQDIQFLNVEAVEGVYTGRQFVRARNLATLDDGERNFLAVRPDRLLSPAGIKYLISGYIPLRDWAKPALAWSLLVGALFVGFLGLNILMRKQWAENERFTFPLTILPRTLFVDEDGRLAIFRNRIMWLGFACALPLVVAKGIRYYVPNFPAPGAFEDVVFSHYVTSPVLQAFLQNVGIGGGTGLTLSFCVIAISLLIETDVLFSLWSMFLIFQLWNMFGSIFRFTRFPGYPWEFQQAMGGFIAYGLLALIVGRQHLWQIVRTVFRRGSAADSAQEVTSYRTALLMVLAALLGLAAWGLWTRMGVVASLLFFGYMLVCGFAASKVRAEMGAPWGYMTPYYGMQFVAAVGGFALFKSTGMLVATIAAGFMCTSCFLLIAPAQVEMMELGRAFRVRPRDVGAGLTLGLLGGLFIGGFVLLCWAYGISANNMKATWSYEQNWYFNQFRVGELNADRAFEAGTLGKTPETRPLNIVKNVDAKGLTVGAGITLALAVLRAKFAWFPFHPIGYVLASSFFMRACWFIFLLAWLIRLILFRIGGAHMIRRGLVPFCVGMFLACMTQIVLFDVVGIILRMNGIVDVFSKMP